MVVFATTPEAMASMIACRLDPLPEMRTTSLNVMIGELVFAVCESSFHTFSARTSRSSQRADYVAVLSSWIRVHHDLLKSMRQSLDIRHEHKIDISY